MAITINEIKLTHCDRDHLIARLKLEKQTMLNHVRQEGVKLGIASAVNLSYEDFQNLEQSSRLGAHLTEEAMEELWQFLDKHHYPEDSRLTDFDSYHLLALNPENKGEFVQGWLEGVMSVWEDIKYDLDS